MPHLLLFLAGPSTSPLLTQGQIDPSTGLDPRAFLARKLDFQRVILKYFRALRALGRKREDPLGGGGGVFGCPQKKRFPLGADSD